MKKFLLTLLFILLLAAGTGIYYLSRTLNAQSYQQQIIAAVFELTGRKMTVSGQTSLSLLPSPTITMTGVYLPNHAGSDKTNMLSADKLKVEIDWGSLFKTPLVVKNIEIDKPVLYLERLQSNRANWEFPFLSAPDENLNDARILGTVSTMQSTRIDNLNISGGTIRYVNKITGEECDLQNINGTVKIDALKGPYTFNGSAHYGKVILTGSANVGRIRNDRAATLKFTVAEKSSGLNLNFAGEITNHDPKSILNGDATFTLKNPPALLETLGLPVLNDVIQKEAVGNFGLQITPLVDTLNNFIIRFGNEDGAFAVTTTLEKHVKTATAPAFFTGDLAVNVLDYAAFKPYFDQIDWSYLQQDKIGENITMTFHVDRFLIRGETIRSLEGEMAYANQKLTVTNGKATLPGKTAVNFTAHTGIQSGKPYVLLGGNMSTDDLRAVLKLADITAQNVPQNLLKKTTAKGTMTLAPGFASLDLSSFKIDTTEGSGSIAWAPQNPKKAELDVTFNNLNLDSYTGFKRTNDKVQIDTLPALMTDWARGAKDLSGWDLSFKTNFKAFTWHALPITSGSMTGSLKGGVLKVDNAEFSGVATATLNVSGEVTGLGTDVANINSMNFNFAAAQLPIFMGRAGLDSTLPLFKQATDAKFAGSFSGSNNTYKTNVLLQLSDASIKLSGGIAKVEDNIRFQNLNVNVSHPNTQKFLTLLNVSNKYVDNLTGALKAQGVLNGDTTDWRLSQGDVSIGVQKLTGDVSYSSKQGKKIAATIASPIFEAERFIPRQTSLIDQNGKLSAKEFDFAPLTEWDIDVKLTAGRLMYKVLDLMNANVAFRIRDRVFTLADFSGKQRGASDSVFKANGTLSWVSEPTLKASVDLTQTPVRPDFMIVNRFSFGGGKVAVRGDFTAAGKSPAAMMANLSGNGSASFTGGQIIGADFAGIDPLIKTTMAQNASQQTFDAGMERLLHSGKTAVNSLGGGFTISGGILRFMDMSLRTPTALANPTQVTWDLSKQAVDVSIPVKLNAYPQFPAFVLGIAVDAGKAVYTTDFADLSNAVSGIVKKEISSQEEQARQQQLAAQEQAAEQRQNAIKQAITGANTAVRQTTRDLQNIGNEKALIALQNATDALTVVNQLAIRENLTTEQENTILQQARLAILKANEAKEEASRDGTLDYRQTIMALEAQADAMVGKMEALHRQKPQIAIIPRLIEASRKNRARIVSARQQIGASTEETRTALLADATAAYGEIEDAYANVMRFDDQLAPRGGDEERSIRGTIRRKGA